MNLLWTWTDFLLFSGLGLPLCLFRIIFLFSGLGLCICLFVSITVSSKVREDSESSILRVTQTLISTMRNKMCMLDVSTQRNMRENSEFTCYSNFNIHDVCVNFCKKCGPTRKKGEKKKRKKREKKKTI